MTTVWATAAAVSDPASSVGWRPMETVRNISSQSGLHLGGDMPNEMAWRAWRDLMRRRRLSPNTIRLRDRAIHDLWAELDARGKTWRQVDPEDLDGWLERVCRPGKRNGGRPLQPGSRNTYARAALCFYRFASARGLLERNPLDEVVPPRRPRRRARALKVSAVGQLLVEFAEDQRLRMMVQLMYHQALRVGEVAALSVEDVALSKDPPTILIHGKGDDDQDMPLSQALIPGLRAYLLTRPPSGPLIPNFRFPTQHLSAAYAAHLLAAAMRPVVGDSGHALRHTAAQQVRLLTGDPFTVKEVLRHASLASVDFYVRDTPGLVAAALAQIPKPLEEAR